MTCTKISLFSLTMTGRKASSGNIVDIRYSTRDSSSVHKNYCNNYCTSPREIIMTMPLPAESTFVFLMKTTCAY